MAGKKKYKIRTTKGDQTAALKKKVERKGLDEQSKLLFDKRGWSKEFEDSEAREKASKALLKEYGPEAMKSRAFLSKFPPKKKVMGEDISDMEGGGSVRKPEKKRLQKIAASDVKQLKNKRKKWEKDVRAAQVAAGKKPSPSPGKRTLDRLETEAAKGSPPAWLYKEGGGTVKRDSRDGYALGGRTKAAREDDSAVLMQAGGYLGGLTESGRGTMAGELGRRGSMPVREAGETMYELSKRRRGFKGGGAASSYNRRYNNQNK